MSCSDSCALFYKKKSVCVSDSCASVGLNCRSYGASNDVYDCLAWCCERDSSTLAVFVVVIIILVICCGFCCAFAVYRFILRKRDQPGQQGTDIEHQEAQPPQKKRRRQGNGSAYSQDSSFSTSSYGARRDEFTSSQGKTASGEQRNVGYDEYSESGYSSRSGQGTRQAEDEEQFEDAPETGFLDEPTASARSERSEWSEASRNDARQRKQLGDSGDHYYEEQYSARSGAQSNGKERVWNGDVSSTYYETPRSGRHAGGATSHLGRPQDNLFHFEEDF